MSRFSFAWTKKLGAWISDPKRRKIVVAVLLAAITIVVALIVVILVQTSRNAAEVEAEVADNPTVTYASAEAMSEVTGVEMDIPEDWDVASYQVVMGVMNQVLVDVDGTQYTLRKLRSATEDISGAYQHWATIETMDSPVGPVTVSQLGDQGAITWNDGEYAHSISATQGFRVDAALGLALP